MLLYSSLSLVPLTPTNFNITEIYQGNMEATVTLDWDPPQEGPAVVDNYIIFISPASPYQQERILVPSRPWNVTLAHNNIIVQYTINLSAVNCAGESVHTFLKYDTGISEFCSTKKHFNQ